MSWALAAGLIFVWVMVHDLLKLWRVPMPSDWLIFEPLRRWALGSGHASDCSLHNAPDYRPWPCSCPRSQGWPRDRIALWLQRKAYDEGRS